MDSNEAGIILRKVERARGHAKQAILRDNPSMQKYFKTAYHPFIHFFITLKTMPPALGYSNFEAAGVNKLLNDLSKRRITGNAAKDAVFKVFKLLDPDSAYLLFRIINKDMKCGVATKTVNKLWPGLVPTHDIMLAYLYDESRVRSWPVLVSAKIDGLRTTWRNGKLLSRNGIELRGLDHVGEAIIASGYTGELDGEMYVHGKKTFDEVSGDIRAFKKSDNAVYYVFDAPSLDDQETRICHAAGAVHVMNLCGYDFLRMVPHILCHTHEEVLAAKIRIENEMAELEIKCDGIVVKDPNAPYVGDRDWAWMKVKNADPVDLVVLDIYEGEPNTAFVGMCGGLIVRFNGVEVRVGGGLSQRQRMAWWQDPDQIIGKTIEVVYQEVTAAGSLRHPRLKTVRGDK